MHGKEGFKQALRWPNGVLAFPRTKFCFEQRKVGQKSVNRLVEPPFGDGFRIIQVYKMKGGEVNEQSKV